MTTTTTTTTTTTIADVVLVVMMVMALVVIVVVVAIVICVSCLCVNISGREWRWVDSPLRECLLTPDTDTRRQIYTETDRQTQRVRQSEVQPSWESMNSCWAVCSGVARICCEEGQSWRLCHGALTVSFKAGCHSCSMTNSFVTNAVLIERAVSCWHLHQLISQTTQYIWIVGSQIYSKVN